MKKLAQGFYTAAQDSNPGSHSGESEALPLSHCALCTSQQSQCFNVRARPGLYELQQWCVEVVYLDVAGNEEECGSEQSQV